jgi:hypothetical protein
MVEIIKQMQATNLPFDIPTIVAREWTNNWVKMPSPIELAKLAKPHEVFFYISKQIHIC